MVLAHIIRLPYEENPFTGATVERRASSRDRSPNALRIPPGRPFRINAALIATNHRIASVGRLPIESASNAWARFAESDKGSFQPER